MSNTQEEYLHSLKRIKEVEDKVQVEIETHRKLIEEEINNLQKQLENAIAASKLEGEKLVEKSIDQARLNATIEADKIMEDAKKKSQTISINLDQKTIKKIIEIFLSGM
jgi:V/A-type H+/Na+-transporting ATPase subunit G/H